MNRNQRRSFSDKQKPTPTFAITKHRLNKVIKHEISQDIEQVKKEAFKQAVHDVTAAFVISLHDGFDFDKHKLTRLLDKVNNQFECILRGDVTIDDIKCWCKDGGLDLEVVFKDG
jgi:polysaccharide pyruvyl transferase WcaK-like protein